MTFKLFLICILIINGAGVLYVIFFVLQLKRDAIKLERLMMAHMNVIEDKKHELGVIYDGME